MWVFNNGRKTWNVKKRIDFGVALQIDVESVREAYLQNVFSDDSRHLPTGEGGASAGAGAAGAAAGASGAVGGTLVSIFQTLSSGQQRRCALGRHLNIS